MTRISVPRVVIIGTTGRENEDAQANKQTSHSDHPAFASPQVNVRAHTRVSGRQPIFLRQVNDKRTVKKDGTWLSVAQISRFIAVLGPHVHEVVINYSLQGGGTVNNSPHEAACEGVEVCSSLLYQPLAGVGTPVAHKGAMTGYTEGLVMMRRTTQAIFKAMMVTIILTQPALACMEHEMDWYEPMEEEAAEEDAVEEAPEDDSASTTPTEERSSVSLLEPAPPTVLECDSDLACPSGMLCEPVSCCEAESCVCPAAVCERPATGAQGRDCEADTDCGDGFQCIVELDGCDDALNPGDVACRRPAIGWCEAASVGTSALPAPRSVASGLDGCQGGTDHGLPLSVALLIVLSVAFRRQGA